MRQVPYFKDLDAQTLEELHYRLDVLNVESNAKVFSRGSKCSDIIIVASGEIEIYVEANRESTNLDVIGKGSVIG